LKSRRKRPSAKRIRRLTGPAALARAAPTAGAGSRGEFCAPRQSITVSNPAFERPGTPSPIYRAFAPIDRRSAQPTSFH
jgi:hypothetical protein